VAHGPRGAADRDGDADDEQRLGGAEQLAAHGDGDDGGQQPGVEAHLAEQDQD
jgi:hypothetical protein